MPPRKPKNSPKKTPQKREPKNSPRPPSTYGGRPPTTSPKNTWETSDKGWGFSANQTGLTEAEIRRIKAEWLSHGGTRESFIEMMQTGSGRPVASYSEGAADESDGFRTGDPWRWYFAAVAAGADVRPPPPNVNMNSGQPGTLGSWWQEMLNTGSFDYSGGGMVDGRPYGGQFVPKGNAPAAVSRRGPGAPGTGGGNQGGGGDRNPNPTDGPNPNLPGGGEEDEGSTGGGNPVPTGPSAEQLDAFAYLTDALGAWGLSALTDWAWQSILEGKSNAMIVNELRQRPEYLAVFPENKERLANGLSFMPEGQILQYRDEAKRLSNQYFGATPTNAQIAKLVGNNISIAEYEHKLVVGKRVQDFGPAVKQLFETSIGQSLSDDDLQEFFDEEQNTEEWDRAYENARYRGQPTLLGLDQRSQTEADLLRSMGVNPDEAFGLYQNVSANAPRFEKLAQIEGGLTSQLPEDFGSFLQNMKNDSLVRALVFQDPGALSELQQMTAREIARFNVGGGVVFDGSKAVGLKAPQDR